jgi:branched-chain amino acid transport system permease protein
VSLTNRSPSQRGKLSSGLGRTARSFQQRKVSRRFGWAVVGVVWLAVAVLSALSAGYILTDVTEFLTLGSVAISFQIISGLAGEFSLAQGTFFGIGGYTSTALLLHFGLSPWYGLLISGLATGVIGMLFGLLVFAHGLRFLYFAIACLGLAEAAYVIANHISWIGGSIGLLIPLDAGAASMSFEDPRWYAWTALGLMAAAFLVQVTMIRSRLGVSLRVMRRDEDLGSSLGMRAVPAKAVALGISACIAGMSGTIYAEYTYSVTPSAMFDLTRDFEIILAVLLGGIDVLIGPLLGLAVVIGATQAVANWGAGNGYVSEVAYGVLILLVAVALPDGIGGHIRSLRAISRSSGALERIGASLQGTTVDDNRIAPQQRRVEDKSEGGRTPTRERWKVTNDEINETQNIAPPLRNDVRNFGNR